MVVEDVYAGPAEATLCVRAARVISRTTDRFEGVDASSQSRSHGAS